MKNFKRLVVLVLLVLTVTSLAGCGSSNGSVFDFYDKSELFVSIPDTMKVIEDEDSLVYHKDTKVVYIMITLRREYNFETAGYFAPYISENGKYCRYVDGKIVEIE